MMMVLPRPVILVVNVASCRYIRICSAVWLKRDMITSSLMVLSGINNKRGSSQIVIVNYLLYGNIVNWWQVKQETISQ